ncbi:hypothetical protein SCAR479_10357 [Seiridium cardinale]|uniref:Uncharacterized protein n=1 Tax=Seiridium cardinale TaxID=138064 RepID=A0ABR2XH15_9PEZI
MANQGIMELGQGHPATQSESSDTLASSNIAKEELAKTVWITMVKGHDTTIASLDEVDKKKPDGWLELCYPKSPNDFNSDADIRTVGKIVDVSQYG